VTRLSSSIARKLRLATICLLVLTGASMLTGAATGTSSSAKLSAHLTSRSFTGARASSVKLVCKFTAPSKHFSYLITRKNGKKWQTVKSVKRTGSFKGSCTTTVKKLFAGKPIKLGSHRLKLTVDTGSKLLSFAVIKGVKPANSALPTISGTARQGQTLSASRGSWKNAPTAYAYRWDRCTVSGAICADIGGATSTTYALVAADVGLTIRVIVTATNAYGSASAISSKTAVVTGIPPANTAPPVISGTVRDGQTLSTSDGSWTGSPAPSLSYQWLRCDGSGANCQAISGATATSYTLAGADDDSTIRVRVTGTNSAGSAGAQSSQTAVVVPVAANTSAGYDHSCAVLSSGKVECWGTNSHGQLGDGTRNDSASPVLLTNITNAVQVSAGYEHTCALLSDHTVKCWGANEHGQVGNNAGGNDVLQPAQVVGVGSSGTLAGVAAVSTGGYHTCALLSSGGVDCWGDDESGQLGNGQVGPTYNTASPVAVYASGTDPSGELLSSVTSLSSGWKHTCAVSAGGVYCWGFNLYGALGNGSTGGSEGNPVQVTGLSATAVAAGDWHSCALLSGGTVDCWGYNGDGELGHGTYGPPEPSPSAVFSADTTPLNGVVSLNAGGGHNCATFSGGTVECWGAGNSGQLGNGALGYAAYPVQVYSAGTTPLAGASGLGLGERHSCAVLSGGTVECWGDNSGDQLGTGTIGHSSNPVQVRSSATALLTNVTQVSAGADHTCALAADTSVWCWGFNGDGELGNNSTTDSSTPVEVTGIGGSGFLTGVLEVSAGDYFTCARLSSGVVCWGNNYYGQLGNGASSFPAANSPVPIQVVGVGNTGTLPAMSQLSAGGWHACARNSSGNIFCWGDNFSGQLGDGSSGSESSSPVQVMNSSTPADTVNDATSVSAGGGHTCAIRSTDKVWCWGDDYYGQLGDNGSGSGAKEVYPVQSTGAPDAAQVSAGVSSTCMLGTGTWAGQVWCWGLNASGQLGDDDYVNSSLAVQVVGVDDVGNLSGVTQLSVGAAQVCARRSDSSVVCWGSNGSGELGDGTLNGAITPVVTGLPANNASTVSAGGDQNRNHSCALAGDGTIYCWGSDYYGQLGVNGLGTSPYPLGVYGLFW
jgi:alpha-tubulin suppressor-like RCC1 family protein